MTDKAEKVVHLALRYPKSKSPFEGAVMPRRPPIDKIAALYLFNTANSGVRGLVFWTENECSPEQFAKWRDERTYPIYIGDRKYHEAGVGSATEFVAREFGIELTPGVTRLIDLLNKNNLRGTLRHQAYPIALWLREFYWLGDSSDHEFDVIAHATHVIDAFVRVENGEIGRSIEDFETVFGDLIVQFKGCQDGPMTLGRYLRDL